MDTGEEHTAVIVIHGVGETNAGWINPHIIEPLASPHSALTCPDHSELHPLSTGDDVGNRFTAVMRPGRVAGSNVSFVEMIWSDISKVSGGALAYLLAVFNLIFVGPGVLAGAFMRRRWRGLYGLIGFFVLASSRILGWWIVGLNVTILICAAFVTAIWQLQASNILPVGAASATPNTSDQTGILIYSDENAVFWLAPPVLMLLVVGITTFRRSLKTDIGWSQFGLGLAVSSAAVLIIAGLSAALPAEVAKSACTAANLGEFCTYWTDEMQPFDRGRFAVFLSWLLWCGTVLIAIALLLVAHLFRAIMGIGKNHIPISAIWVAMFTILVQAVLFKLVITPASILSCDQLRSAHAAMQIQRHGGEQRAAIADDAHKICDNENAAGVFSFTTGEFVLLLLVLIAVVLVRQVGVRRLDTAKVPRLIVHPALVVVVIFSVVAHIVVFLEHMLHQATVISSQNLPGLWADMAWWQKAFFPVVWLQAALGEFPKSVGYDRVWPELKAALILFVPVYISLLWRFHEVAKPVVHIARQLVDHQYLASKSMMERIRKRDEAWEPHPRRRLVASRLNAITASLLSGRRINKLVFLTHSQGTVVMFDFLKSPNGRALLKDIDEIHVVTMGSPLSHIYSEYFEEYRSPVERQAIGQNVKTWTNYWRIDDPIGNRVDVISGDFIQNVMLPKGGHVDYWREDVIRKHICSLIGAQLERVR